MSKKAFARTLAMYKSDLTPTEQEEFKAEIGAQGTPPTDSKLDYHDGYRRGFDVGFDKGSDEAWKASLAKEDSLQRLNDDFNTYTNALSYVFGITVAGFGKVPYEMLKTLSGKIAEAGTRIDAEVRLIEQQVGESIPLNPLVAEWESITNALNALYAGEDPTGAQLRAIASNYNPTIRENLKTRAQLAPGRSKNELDARIYKRAKDLRREQPELTDGEIYDQLGIDLEKDPTAQDEFIRHGAIDPATFERGFRRFNRSA